MSVRKYPGKRGAHWYAVIELGRDPAGKRLQDIIRKDPDTGLPIPTKKRAQEIEREELVRRHRGQHIDPDTTPFGEFLDRWLEETKSTRAESTHYLWRSVVRKRIKPLLGDAPLGAIKTADIERLYRVLVERGNTVGSTGNVRCIVSGALKAAVRWHLIDSNPSRDAAMPKAAPRERRPIWTAEQVRIFLAKTETAEWSALWRILLDSAIRIGEARALMWRDCDFEGRTIEVRKTVAGNDVGVDVIVSRTKSVSGQRTITLAPATIDALRRHKAKQNKRRLELGEYWRDLDLMFDRGDGGIIDDERLCEALTRDAAAAGVPRLTPHGLRHTSLTLLASVGESLHALKNRAGHANLAMTADLYAHASQEADQRLATVMERLLGP